MKPLKPLGVLLACSIAMNVVLLGTTGYYLNANIESRNWDRVMFDGHERISASVFAHRRYHDKDRRRTMLDYRLTYLPDQNGYRIEIFSLTNGQTVLDDILKTDMGEWDAERAALEWIHDNG